MADIERVKENIKICINPDSPCFVCEYKKAQECTTSLLTDALSVIEELQAEIERLKGIAKNGNGFIEKCDSRTAQMFSH